MDVDPGYEIIEKFQVGVQWFFIQSKDFISSVDFKLKNENNELVSFNAQSMTFRLYIEEILSFLNDEDFNKFTIFSQ